MRHQNSVFHSVMKQVPWDAFDRLVAAHGTDWRVRRLTTKDQFVALLFGQLSGASSLREIELGLASHAARLYHLGAHPALPRPWRTPTPIGQARCLPICSPRWWDARIADCGARWAKRFA